MIKSIFLTLLACFSLFNKETIFKTKSIVSISNSSLVLEPNGSDTFKVIGVNDENVQEIRIYYDENQKITEIEGGAFDSCLSLHSIMISYSVTIFPNDLFSDWNVHSTHFSIINYTGSQSEWETNSSNMFLPRSVNIFFQSCDEGFIRTWRDIVGNRYDTEMNQIAKDDYDTLISLYNHLSVDDKKIVNDFEYMEGTTIYCGLLKLRQFFDKDISASKPTKEVSSDTMISLIIVIALIGMTFIMVFYYLKDKKIIY